MYKHQSKRNHVDTDSGITQRRIETDHVPNGQEQVKETDGQLKLANELAKIKKINLMKNNATVKPRNIKCEDCKTQLVAETWFGEEILFFGRPMIKYWFVWRKELRPAAYSWPTRDQLYICPGCFGERDSARKRTPSHDEAREAARKSGIKLIDGGPYFPDRKRRFCQKCTVPLTNRGWFSSEDLSKNDKDIYYCWDVRDSDLVPLAIKTVGQNDVYVCMECYRKSGDQV